MDLKSIIAVVGVVLRRGQVMTVPPSHSIFPVSEDAQPTSEAVRTSA